MVETNTAIKCRDTGLGLCLHHDTMTPVNGAKVGCHEIQTRKWKPLKKSLTDTVPATKSKHELDSIVPLFWNGFVSFGVSGI